MYLTNNYFIRTYILLKFLPCKQHGMVKSREIGLCINPRIKII